MQFKPLYVSHQRQGSSVVIQTDTGQVIYTALSSGSIQINYLLKEAKEFPSFAVREGSNHRAITVLESATQLILNNGGLKAVINKDDLSVNFYRKSTWLSKQTSAYSNKTGLGFNFQLANKEKIIGGGERVLGMDRRGQAMPLYNRAHYGYSTQSNQMSFSLPAIMSDKKYTILFDNSAKGTLDIGKNQKDTLSFKAVGGRLSYVFFSADSYPKLIEQYVEVTGKQPMPPRWAFGNFSSRFGYKNQQQVIDTVKKFQQEDFPLDTIIIDLYWFGPDIKGHVGNLDWDTKAFPTPEKMIQQLQEQKIKTVLVTEPFILTSSSKWEQAVKSGILAKDEKGDPKRFNFYFGNTGLIDLFDKKAQTWFSNIYTQLAEQGVAGVWGDLGEPEVHPDDSLHWLSEQKMQVTGDLIHNAYGHQWAKTVYQNQLKTRPKQRPFIMMRAGFAGSQRYGMIPWTGDVERSWNGLKPQVELSLQMGLLGLAYTHSDLGGFAGGKAFDKEMYIRWLQYGVFQPIYRPHAQDHIAPEPVFHDQQTKNILRKFIKLRYRLLPYIYTMAYQNSRTGMPLMRPVFFEDENNKNLIDEKNVYLWGDSFLVSPITQANETEHPVKLPKGIWFDFWNDEKYQGGNTVKIPVSLQTLPVLVRAGSFIPMGEAINNTEDYSSENLTLHYYADPSVNSASAYLYEDDGVSNDSIAHSKFELLDFSFEQQDDNVKFIFSKRGKGYLGMPKTRAIKLIIHNWHTRPKMVSVSGKQIPNSDYFYQADKKKLEIAFQWQQANIELLIEKKETWEKTNI